MLTTQSRVTLGVLCQPKTCMLDFAVPSYLISFEVSYLGSYVALEDIIEQLRLEVTRCRGRFLQANPGRR